MHRLFKHLDFYRRLLERRLENALAELLGPGERYRLVDKLGRGGMGEVWLGVDRKLGRRVAVKLMRADTAMDPAATARFEREISATIELAHPHTVRVYDHGVTVDGVRYYVMELLEGRNLSEVLDDDGPLKPTRAVELVRQAASALAEAHHVGIIHRDVKLQNFVVVSSAGRRDFLKVLDFGLAIGAEDPSVTAEGLCAGSPSYVSPEVIMGRPADARSDIYGLGCVLYALLTGRPPFIGQTARDVLLAHLHMNPDPPSRHSPEPLPPELDRLVIRCLAKDPGRRPPSAAAFFDELVHFLRVHASRVFRQSPAAPRLVPAHEPTEPVLTRIAVRMPGFHDDQDGEDAPTQARGGRPPRSYRRLYEEQLEVTKDVCIDDSIVAIDDSMVEMDDSIVAIDDSIVEIDDSIVEIDPEDLDTYPEPRREVRFVA